MNLTEGQIATLATFTHRQSWKADLRAAWETGNYRSLTLHNDGHLQQLRNTLGPAWLQAYRPGDTRVGWLKKGRQERISIKRTWFVNAYRIVDAEGVDMVQPWSSTKTDARQVARQMKITLIEGGSMTSLAEALAEVGDDNIKFQVLSSSVTNASQGRKATKITFETENGLLSPAELLHGDFKNIGLVVWVDRKKWDEALAAVKSRAVVK